MNQFSKIAVMLVSIGAASGDAHAQSFGDLLGRWVNSPQGEFIEITADSDVQDSRLGQGRIGSTIDYGANYVIAYQGGKYCWYYVNIISGGTTLILAVRNPDQSEITCLSGVFVRAQ